MNDIITSKEMARYILDLAKQTAKAVLPEYPEEEAVALLISDIFPFCSPYNPKKAEDETN